MIVSSLLALGLLNAQDYLAFDPNSHVGLRPSVYRINSQYGRSLYTYHPCGCIVVAAGQGDAFMPCKHHQSVFDNVLQKADAKTAP